MAHPTATTESTDTLASPIVARIRQQLDRVVVRVRTALDLPSRSELVELTRRLEDLDQRIAQLAAERVAAMSAPLAALPEAAPVEAAPEPVAVAEEPVAAPPATSDEPAVATAVAPAHTEDAAVEPEPAKTSPGSAPGGSKKNKNRRR